MKQKKFNVGDAPLRVPQFEDAGHSDYEERIIVVGLSQAMRILTVIHCWRENDTIIRIISARKATHLEEKLWKR